MTVLGEIEAISLLPRDNQYNVKISSLTEGLITSYNKDLPFRQEMRGTGEIIIQNRRLIERLFNQIREIFGSEKMILIQRFFFFLIELKSPFIAWWERLKLESLIRILN